jgi:hypothetical protein
MENMQTPVVNQAPEDVGSCRCPRIVPRVIVAFGLACTVACSTLRTTTEPVGGSSYAENSKARVGLYYFLPRALITIECIEPKAGIFNIVVSKKMVADRTHRYHLRWTRNPFYDDKVPTPIAVNGEGLLTNVDMSTTDQTPGIATDLTSTAISVFKILSGGGPQAGDLKIQRRPLQPFKYTFDPLNDDEVRQTQAALEGFGIVVSIDTGRMPKSVRRSKYQSSKEVVSAMNSSSVEAGRDLPDEGGVFFHPPTTVNLRFDLRGAGAELIHRENVSIPDPDRVASFRFGRSPLVKRDTTLTLVDGIPTSFKVERPSVVKAFTSTVSSIAGSVAGAIPTIVNVQSSREVSELNAEKSHLAAERSVLEEQKKLLQEKKNLMDAQRALTQAQGEGPDSGRLDQHDPAGDVTSADGFTPAHERSPSPTPTPSP